MENLNIKGKNYSYFYAIEILCFQLYFLPSANMAF